MEHDILDEERKDESKFDPEKQNVILRRRLFRCKERLAGILNIYDAAPPGRITIDEASMIREADKYFCALMNAAPEKIVGKPISLFINSEDIVQFFARRNHVFSNKTPEIFDLGFRPVEGDPIQCRVDCKLKNDEKAGGVEMKMAVADISGLRQKEDRLQCQDDLLNIIFSLSRDLNNATAGEYDDVVLHCLKTIGLFTGADRCFICQLHENDLKMYNFFEWCSHKKVSKKRAVSGVDFDKFPRIETDMKRNKIVSVRDFHLLSSEKKEEYEAFHAPGVKSLLTVPIVCCGASIGILGLDAVSRKKSWGIEIQKLLKHISELFVNLLIRQRLHRLETRINRGSEKEISSRNKNRRQNEDRSSLDAPADMEIAEVSIDWNSQIENKAAANERWSFSRAKISDTTGVASLRKNDSNILSIMCPGCRGEITVGHSQVAEYGHVVEARCPCGKKFPFKIESREAYRKSLHLNGFFIQNSSGIRNDKQGVAWGNIIITNISKQGLGFRTLESAGIQKGDLIKLKFKLDNTLGSTIEKEAEVKNVSGDYVGCVFTKADKYDVTLGFYLM